MKKQLTFKLSRVCKLMLVLLGMFFVSHMPVSAQTSDTGEMNYIIVWDNGGGNISFPLQEKPIFKYLTDQSVVSCITTETTIDLPLGDVCKYTLATEPPVPTLVENVTTDGEMAYRADRIYLSHFASGTMVSIFKVDGAAVASYRADASGNVVIATDGWTEGIYIIKVNNVSYKISKK